MRKRFISVDRSTPQMFPPRIDDYLPEDHLARFVVEIVEQLDLRNLVEAYSGRGSSAYHPAMMVALLFYGYATGTFSSRKLERATYEGIAYRYICANSHPDHDSINSFRKRFGKELEGLFVEVLAVAREMGMVKMGTVSLDGTKVKANASRHKALSWKKAKEIEEQIKKEVEELMRLGEEAESGSLPEDMEIPKELERREGRVEVIRRAKLEIEARAKRRYEEEMEEYREKMEKRKRHEEETGKKFGGRKPEEPGRGPGDRDQVNLVDEESRIMPGSGGGFDQSYNAQASVEGESRLIVTRHVTQNTNDKREVEPTLEQLRENGRLLGEADSLLADAGYFSESNVDACVREGIRPYISGNREKHNKPLWERFGREEEETEEPVTAVEEMRRRLKTMEGRKLYAKRKSTVEPVFGVIKHVMGFRQFLRRGIESVGEEWNLVCIGYNLKRMHVLRG